ncbi:anti-sigma factor domain-containing protein [Metabacillus idriensis]|uniref:anti-sigma factor domain-containing protein n=1 Tax=Metabacillus idriensis TaxID=324768 RepID=UPI00174B5D01|nr:anti-sigma factor domain-containing protein [Metabacillus idriensis]
MKKGIVVERNDDYVTLLTPDGQFLKANKQKRSYELGEEITFFQLSDTSEKEAKSLSIFSLKGIRNGFLAVIALMIILFTVLPVFNNDKVYAYMTIDINPSFELGLNEKLQVVLIEPMNEDGEKMLNDLKDWKNRKLSEVFTKIVDKSSDLGYMKEGKEIFVATVLTDQEHEEVKKKMLEDVEQLKNSYQKKNMTVNAVESDAETRKKAADQGISTGKYIKLNPQVKEGQTPENADPSLEEKGKEEDTEKNIDEKTDSGEQKPPVKEEEKTVPPASEKPIEKEKPDVNKEEQKVRVPQKQPSVPEPPKDQISYKEIWKEAEKRKKEEEKKWREEQKKKSSRDEDRDDDDDNERDRDRNEDDRNNEDREDDRDRDDDDNDKDDDDREGSRSDRD